jgi:N-acetylneuraminate synthase
MKTKVIAEIGINHNGDINLAKKLIDISAAAGCQYVKFQKRTPEICVPEEQKGVMRSTPWGEMRYIDYKHKLEFGQNEFDEIANHCKQVGVKWFASVWDIEAVEFMRNYSSIMKVPSALIDDLTLLKEARNSCKTLMISTGMSTEEEIDDAVLYNSPDVIFHTCSGYPSPVEELKMDRVKWMQEKYPNTEIGYSGHEFGLVPSYISAALGCSWIERHVTLDRTMFGSDQMASVEPGGLFKLIKGIKDIEKMMGGYGEREVQPSELKKRKSLRGV